MDVLLSDRDTYTVLGKDPIGKYKKNLKSIVKEGHRKRVIRDKEQDYPIPLAPRTPIIYNIPKVH